MRGSELRLKGLRPMLGVADLRKSYMYPDDVDALWHRLKDKVEVAWPIENMVYGMREFAIRDVDGYTLTFGKDMESE